MPEHKAGIYELSTGEPVTSLTPFTSPIDEYYAAFEERAYPFLNYYTFKDGVIEKRTLTRGEFWELACSAAACLTKLGLSKGDRIIHCFSANSLYDLAFRLAAVLTGCVSVTINWQADDNERVLYKANITDAKLVVYDDGFANRIQEMKTSPPAIPFLKADIADEHKVTSQQKYPSLGYDDEKIIVFTSGTTGKPKGVSLSHRSYLANRLTFESYFMTSETMQLDLFLTNPLHHTNSSALSDWGMRRKRAIIHLLERYTTAYWKILTEVAHNKRGLLIAPMVSRHIDFLEDLTIQSKLPVDIAKLKEALNQTDILIGSAPVGPTTINRILKFSNHLPHVRFGSTETCLQVMATPITMAQDKLMKAFEAGWSYRRQGEEAVGYYIGREHFPFTRVKIVKSIEPGSQNYMHPCEIGEPGYLITQGPNIMSYYVGDAEATKAVFREGWYIGLKDIAFTLRNSTDGQLDYYWASRDSELLIRGGANYAYDQIAAELTRLVETHFHLRPDQFKLAVVGLRLESEHEDSCCVTIELNKEVADVRPKLEANLIKKARVVSKAARPDYVRFGPIPRSFKGAVLYPQLKQEYLDSLKNRRRST
jgi:acyl-CoA synthetase (AMP-forming)/AMP-acid ligase II